MQTNTNAHKHTHTHTHTHIRQHADLAGKLRDERARAMQ